MSGAMISPPQMRYIWPIGRLIASAVFILVGGLGAGPIAMAPHPHEAALALHRFGLGPRSGSIPALASDPRAALLAELETPGAGLIRNASLRTSQEAVRAVFEFNQERQARAKVQAERQRVADAMGAGAGTAMDMKAETAPENPNSKKPPPLPQQIVLDEAKARLDAGFAADIGFVERLVWFWSNHFCISADKIPSMTGAYEREAIRPHVLGRFADMLLAVESHPAMLFYLDNSASIGPNSVAGINRSRGLNENLAREVLELHTLGVRSGYSQDDVTRFAYVLTGWTFIEAGNPKNGGEFVFIPRLHEPGAHEVVGKTYADGGVAQGRAVLADLARHPATATHIATKLARHFVADEPPPALVARLAQRFRDTGGDLKEMAKALVAAPQAWSPSADKPKRPSERLMAMARATGSQGTPQRGIQ